MIIVPNWSRCLSCKKNICVFQPSIADENEWLKCDEYNQIPVDIVTNKTNCEYFEKSDVKIIGQQ